MTEGEGMLRQHLHYVWLTALLLICKPGTPHVLVRGDIRRTHITSVNKSRKKNKKQNNQTNLANQLQSFGVLPQVGNVDGLQSANGAQVNIKDELGLLRVNRDVRESVYTAAEGAFVSRCSVCRTRSTLA